MTRVLVVDEDPRIRELITSVLLSAGHEASSVPDVYLALAHIRAGAPDLLISDVVASDHGGLWLLQAVRVQFPEVPIIMMADEPDEGDDLLHRALSLGASDTLLKPVHEGRLRAAVERLLGADDAEAEPPEA